MTVQDFLDALGGTASVARALNRPLSSVASWAHRGSIPEWRLGAVAELARRNDPPIAVPASFDKPQDAAA